VREMRGDEPDFAKIGRLIGGDVGLAGAMLKTVNSPFYGLRSKATTVPQALSLLGLRNVAQLVNGLLLRQVFAESDNSAMEEFWESSLSIALIAAWLAPRVKGVNRDDAYTFALFRDCGIPVLMTAFKDCEPAHRGSDAANNELTRTIEIERYGVDHASVGYKMATSWLLPDATCEAVRHHHDYAELNDGEAGIPGSSIKLIVLALAAEWLFTMHTSGTKCPEWDEAGNLALQQLGIAQEQLEAFMPEIGDILSSQ
jgi:HD-like signal output (HDOD) protein